MRSDRHPYTQSTLEGQAGISGRPDPDLDSIVMRTSPPGWMELSEDLEATRSWRTPGRIPTVRRTSSRRAVSSDILVVALVEAAIVTANTAAGLCEVCRNPHRENANLIGRATAAKNPE